MSCKETELVKSPVSGRVSVEALLPEDYIKARFELVSDRNRSISSLTDISPFDPVQTPGKECDSMAANVWFPVVDIRLEPGMYGKAWITGASECRINSYFNGESGKVEAGETIFSAGVLSEWENGLFVKGKEAVVHSFAVVKEFYAVPTISRKIVCEFKPLDEDWGGSIQVFYMNREGQWKLHDIVVTERDRDMEFTQIGTEDKEEALNLCVEYLINSCNHTSANPYFGGLFLFYDCDADTYRNGQWPWSWGTAVKFLLECAAVSGKTEAGIRFRRTSEELINTAYQIGLTTLKFQIKNKEHTANGFGTTRYTPRNFSDFGYQELVNSGSDTGFLCGWAWMPLYEATKDAHFLEAAKEYIRALEAMIDNFVLPPQEWLPEPQCWTDFTIDESGFGTEGIAEVYRITKEERYKKLCAKYMDKHLAIFEREDGLWDRKYTFSTVSVEKSAYMTRGLGWAMEGLLAAHRCVPEGGIYLDKAKKMAAELMKYQRIDGSWGFQFTDQTVGSDTAEKGTSLWCLLLYTLYQETGEDRYLFSARAALEWCMKNQYIGSNSHARGGIISISGESGVTYRSYYRLCCQYTTSFFGLALLRELVIAEQ